MKQLLTTISIYAALTLPTFAERYERIASAGGDITEIIYALGAGDKVIGVDSTSGFPADVSEKKQIGYVRGLAAEGILSINPDLLIGADDMGPPNVIENMKSAGLDVAIAPAGLGAERVPIKIKFVGEILGLEDEADQLIAQYKTEMQAVAKEREALTLSHKVLFILSVRDGAPIVGGRMTSANDIIEMAGGTNVAASFEGWKPMNAEAIIAAAPDLILMTEAHSDRVGGKDAILKRPDIALTPAVISGNIATMDAMLLLGFGPRTPTAVSQLISVLQKIEL